MRPASAPAGLGEVKPTFRRVALALLGVVLLPLAQSSAGATGVAARSIAPDDLMLDPSDFPGTSLRVAQRVGQRETRDGGQTAQVILRDDRLEISEGVVVFPSEDASRAALQTLRADEFGAPQVDAAQTPAFGQDSIVRVGQPGTRTVSAFIRQGPVLVRLTLVGTTTVAEMTPYARKVEEKLRRAGGMG